MDGPVYKAIGRRKDATASVRLVPGSGQILVNKRPVEEYFPRPTLVMVIQQPLKLTESLASVDIHATCKGGRDERSGRRTAAWHLAGTHGVESRSPVDSQERRLPYPRPAYGGAEEVRAARCQEAVPVLEALSRRAPDGALVNSHKKHTRTIAESWGSFS